MPDLFSEPPDDAGVHVPPSARLVSSVGAGHKLETAVADLVDNSIDAEARNVLVRFLIGGDSVRGLMVIDDGRGMNETQMNKAMQYGGQDYYESTALGHYGIGMKVSSMSQGDEMSVYSRRAGYTSQGRWMSRESIDAAAPLVKRYRPGEVDRIFAATPTDFDLDHGTIVAITQPRNFVTDGDADEVNSWLSSAQDRLDKHLGGIHHRILESGRVSIKIDQFDVDLDEAGGALGVSFSDPFAHTGTGAHGFPMTFVGSIAGHDFEMIVDIWPSHETHRDNFVVGVNDTADGQGFYIYRHDRLLQAGGWNEVITPTRDRRFIRIGLEIDKTLERYVRMNPEKNGIEFTGPFRQAIKRSRSRDGRFVFDDIDTTSASVNKASKKRTRQEKLIVRPESGLDRRIVDAMGEHIGFDENHQPVRIVWQRLSPHRVFEVVPSERTLILNDRYHDDLTKLGSTGKPAGPRQAPLLTTLVYLLVRRDLERATEGTQWSHDQEAIQKVLVEAILAQREWESRMGLSSDRWSTKDEGQDAASAGSTI